MTSNTIKPDIILHLAAEGGGVTVLGMHVNGTWLLQLKTNDSTLSFIDESDVMERAGEWVNTVDEALSGVPWPWHVFWPRTVHHAFGKAIWYLWSAKVKADGGDGGRFASAWRLLCLGDKQGD